MSTTQTTSAPLTDEKLARMLEKITLMLNKAENTPYPAEAQTFQEHAERLMVRYGIGKAQLDDAAGKLGKKREQVIEVPYQVGGNYRIGQVRGLEAIARSFPAITVLQSTFRNKTTMFLIGHESDVQRVVQLFDSLMIQVQTATVDWWKGVDKSVFYSESERRMERRQFQLGFFGAVARRVFALYREEAATADGAGTELVLVGRKDRVDDWVTEAYPELREIKAKRLQAGSRGAQVAGQVAGERADVGSKRVNDSQRAGALV